MSRLFLLICSFVAAICCTCTTMAFVSFLRSIFADGCAWYSATARRPRQRLRQRRLLFERFGRRSDARNLTARLPARVIARRPRAFRLLFLG